MLKKDFKLKWWQEAWIETRGFIIGVVGLVWMCGVFYLIAAFTLGG